MKLNPSSRRLLPWVGAILLSVTVTVGIIEATRLSLEHNYKEELATEVKRRGIEVTAQTMNGNVMGAVSALGLVDQPIKKVARNEIPLDTPVVMESLQAIGQSYDANGAYLVNPDGIIKSSWDTVGVPLTGVDVKFRPYFQIAMQGKRNIYAAIGTTTGMRSLYFAAPLYGEVSASAPIIGAVVARLGLERVDSVLRAWSGPALLLSPQKLVFASNREAWIDRLAGPSTPERLKAIKTLKQFGKVFDSGTPKTLPFDLASDIVSFEKHRYAIARTPVQWNDPNGPWTLVLLGDLDKLMPASRRTMIGLTSGLLMLALSTAFLIWRQRLQHANQERQRAEAELKEYACKLELDSSIKSYLAEVSADLQQAVSLDEFAHKFMLQITPRLDADYGAFYVFDEGSQQLTLAGGYGALPHGLEKVPLGQGLVGQCAKDMTPIVIADSTGIDVSQVWGEGAIAPKSTILAPVVRAGRLMGMVVLAALQDIDPEKRALLDTILPMMSMNLEILERNLDTQRQAETLRKQQTYLQETEAWYRGIIESAPDGMLVADEQGVIILANPQIDAMFGYMTDTLIGQNIEVLVPAAMRAYHMEWRENYFQSGITHMMGRPNKDLIGIRRDSTTFPVEVSLSKLPALGGHGLCVCASVRDITQRRKDEAELATLEERSRLILGAVGDGIIGIDTEDRITFANPAVPALLGYTEGELIGHTRHSLVHYAYPDGRDFPREECAMYQTSYDGQPRQVDNEVLWRKDGNALPVEYSITPAYKDGRIVGSVIVFRDITERKQVEAELLQNLAELERFNRLVLGREEKMIQLKQEINELREQLGQGKRYKIVK